MHNNHTSYIESTGRNQHANESCSTRYRTRVLASVGSHAVHILCLYSDVVSSLNTALQASLPRPCFTFCFRSSGRRAKGCCAHNPTPPLGCLISIPLCPTPNFCCFEINLLLLHRHKNETTCFLTSTARFQHNKARSIILARRLARHPPSLPSSPRLKQRLRSLPRNPPPRLFRLLT